MAQIGGNSGEHFTNAAELTEFFGPGSWSQSTFAANW